MAQTFTVDDASPLIAYPNGVNRLYKGAPFFSPRHSASRWPCASAPSGKTCYNDTLTRIYGYPDDSANYAEFEFYGDSVTVFGPLGPGKGGANYFLDGELVLHSTFPNTTEANPGYVTILYKSGHLWPPKRHTIRIENLLDGEFMDIDKIVWTTTGSPQNGTVRMMQYWDPHTHYSPASKWEMIQDGDAPGSRTYHDKSTLTMYFYGEGIELYGSTGPNHAPYSVEIDGSVRHFNATMPVYQPSVLLYWDRGLAAAPHTMKVSHHPEVVGQVMVLTHAVQFMNATMTNARMEYPFTDPDPSSSPSIPDSNSESDDYMSAGTIIGIVFAVMVPFIAFLVWVVFYFRRRRRRRASTSLKRLHSQDMSQVSYALPPPYYPGKAPLKNPFLSIEDRDDDRSTTHLRGTSLSSTSTYLAAAADTRSLTSSADSHCAFQRAMQTFERTPEERPPPIEWSFNMDRVTKPQRALSVQSTGSSTKTGTTVVSYGGGDRGHIGPWKSSPNG